MNTKAMLKSVQMETILYFRGFFGPFFSFLFPLMMVCLFGSLYGNEPAAMFGGRGSMDVSVPAYLGMVIAVGGLMTLPLGLIEYQANKAYKRFDATPMGKVNIILSQIIVYFLSTVAGSILLVAAGKLLYNIRIDGSWLIILPLFLLSLVAIFSFGFLITAIFKNTKISQAVCYLLYFLMMFLSGASLPAELLTDGIRAISNMLPLTHVVEVMQCAFAGDPLSGVRGSIAVLVGMAFICTVIGIILYRRRKWA